MSTPSSTQTQSETIDSQDARQGEKRFASRILVRSIIIGAVLLAAAYGVFALMG